MAAPSLRRGADWDQAAAELEAGFTLADETGVAVQDLMLHAVASHIARERGRPEEADAHLIAGENIVASGTKHLFGLEMLILERARVAWHHQDVDDACDLLLAMWDTTAPIRGLIQWRLIGPDVVKLCLAAGRHREADGIVTGLGLIAGRSRAPSSAATMQRCAGLVKRDSRMLAVAAEAMLATDRLTEAAGACEDAAEALIDAGAPGRDHDLERMLDAAEQIHLRASATVGLARVRLLRSRAGITREEPTPRPTFGWESLTPKEQEVVTLVSHGLSNPEIAAELFISRRTVEAHLSHVFRKLDVTNRTQLAREAIRRGLT